MKDLIQSDTTARVVATATSGTGLSTVAGLIPDILGCIASGIGIIVTILIWRVQKKKLDLEIKVLKKQLKNDITPSRN